MEILNKIQKELKAPKSQFNGFGKYNYRSCEDILEAVKPLLGTATLTLTDEMVMLGDRFYVKATAFLSEGNSRISCSAFARESLDKKGMDAAQITGAASSYARKYALNGLFCIDDTKDADTINHHEESNKPEKPQSVSAVSTIHVPATTPQVNKIFTLSKELDWDGDMMGDFLELFDVKEVVELNKKQASEAITKLINHPKP